MRGPVLLVVRRLHLYLSVFFAPLLLLFIVSGLAQTMDFDHSTPLLRDLSQVHTKQFFPTAADAGKIGEKIDRARFTELTKPMRWLVAAMCGALLVSICLGLALAFTMVRKRAPVWIALILGIATPVLLLALAHFR
jgi:hypothetical protein